ncbi:alkaline phosphatase family protein [Cellulomonas triticagri]|uniref:Alkaline phosphatase family protein n=1 Tax=Cellulomonas triticagri TaxID=2483352 RepID=A0A3M2JCD5_9CELL|nr:nucleotide pyrophosphatase/phosphodiesterase family protein [Cellulomonas triticagri]RMI09821.1 alkaline phosphatase family protein [Cellulomonas triticagri]
MTTAPSSTVPVRLADAGLVQPDYTDRSLSGLLPALSDALGSPVPGGADARARLGLPTTHRVCVVLVDGLGYENLVERAGHAPFLRSLLEGSAPLSAGYPSTTAASMGSFGTGTNPGRTGLVGYTVRNPRDGRLANMVSWEGLGPARDWQRERTVFESLVAHGVTVTTVGPRKFMGSGLTEAALRGGGYRAAESLPDRVDAALRLLREPGLVYLYWGDVDKTGHHEGVGSWQWGDQVEALDGELRRLARSLPRGASVVVTADHGMVDVDPARRHDVGTDAGLAADVALVAGEPRALHVHLVPGADPLVVADRWTDVLGDDAVVLTRDEAVGAGLFGEVAEHVAPLLGDLVVATTGRATVVDSRTQTAASLQLKGVHGSLTPAEMRVPLLAVHT